MRANTNDALLGGKEAQTRPSNASALVVSLTVSFLILGFTFKAFLYEKGKTNKTILVSGSHLYASQDPPGDSPITFKTDKFQNIMTPLARAESIRTYCLVFSQRCPGARDNDPGPGQAPGKPCLERASGALAKPLKLGLSGAWKRISEFGAACKRLCAACNPFRFSPCLEVWVNGTQTMRTHLLSSSRAIPARSSRTAPALPLTSTLTQNLSPDPSPKSLL